MPDASRQPAVIELRLREMGQLFNTLDPSAFQEKDLDPDAEEFIVGWAQELPRDAPLTLVVHLDRYTGGPDPEDLIEEAVHQFFASRGSVSRRQLRMLMRRGRLSLIIGLLFLAACLVASDTLVHMSSNTLVQIVSEGFIIGGWVSMWRPLEIFLYEWWPIRQEYRLFDRLAAMEVRVMVRG